MAYNRRRSTATIEFWKKCSFLHRQCQNDVEAKVSPAVRIPRRSYVNRTMLERCDQSELADFICFAVESTSSRCYFSASTFYRFGCIPFPLRLLQHVTIPMALQLNQPIINHVLRYQIALQKSQIHAFRTDSAKTGIHFRTHRKGIIARRTTLSRFVHGSVVGQSILFKRSLYRPIGKIEPNFIRTEESETYRG